MNDNVGVDFSGASKGHLRDASAPERIVTPPPRGSLESSLPKDASDRVSDLLSQAGELATEYYGKASSYLETDQGRAIRLVSMVAAAGVFGFIVGRALSRPSAPAVQLNQAI